MGINEIWFVWAVNLLAQNFMFTFVSRARNSGSLRRHVFAAIGSNAVWMMQFQILIGPMMDYLNGKHGRLMQVLTGAYYTFFTVAGSVLAHYYALRNEKGKSAVGANSKYAQIEREEWERIKAIVDAPYSCPLLPECPVMSDWPGFSEKIDEIAAHARLTKAKLAFVIQKEKSNGGNVQRQVDGA